MCFLFVFLTTFGLWSNPPEDYLVPVDSLVAVDSTRVSSPGSYRILEKYEADEIYFRIKELRLSIDSLYVNFDEYYAGKVAELGYDVSPKSQFETSLEYYQRASTSLEVFKDLYWSRIHPLKISLNKLLQEPIRVLIPYSDVTFKNFNADAGICYFKVKDGLWGADVNCSLDYLEGSVAKELVNNLSSYTFYLEYRVNYFDIFKPVSFSAFKEGTTYFAGRILDEMDTITYTDVSMQTFNYTDSGNAFFRSWSDEVNYNSQGQLIEPYSFNMVDLCNPQSKGYWGLDKDYYHYTNLRANGVNVSNNLKYLGTGGHIDDMDLNTRVSKLIRPQDKTGRYTRGKHTVVVDDVYGKHHCVLFSPDSRFVLIGSSSALIFNPETGQKLHDFGIEALDASWSEDGSRISLLTRYSVLIYNAIDLSLIQEYQIDSTKSRFSADGRWLIVSNQVNKDTMISKYIFVSLEKENLRYSRILPIPFAMSTYNAEIIFGKYLIITIDGKTLACKVDDDYSELQEILDFDSDFNVVPSGNSIISSGGKEYFLKLDQVY